MLRQTKRGHKAQATKPKETKATATFQRKRKITTLRKKSKTPSTSLKINAPSVRIPKSSFSTTNSEDELLYHTKEDVYGAKRTHYISDLSNLPEGTNVSISGWIDRVRPMGQLFFVVLRDSTGTIQATLEKHEVEGHAAFFQHLNTKLSQQPSKTSSTNVLYGKNTVGMELDGGSVDGVDMSTVGDGAYDAGMNLGPEYVVSVKGVIQDRPTDMIKKSQVMGSKEIRIRGMRVLNTSKPLPIALHDEFELTNEDHRMKHRYLDLRRDFNQYVLKLRSQLTMQARMAMYFLGFQEIETPYLVKSTPEGAREFLVPSRSAGKFYALPQSPQQFKQLLMCGGFDKYFQIARCFRDESGRQDRQPEFTQLDLELSFTTPDMVMKSVETMVNTMHLQAYGVPMKELKKIRFIDALNRFGSDKPDLRFSSELHDITHYFTDAILKEQNGSRPGLGKNKVKGNGKGEGIEGEEKNAQEQQQQQPEPTNSASLSTTDYIKAAQWDNIEDDTVGNLLKIYPPFLEAQEQLKTAGKFGHFVQDGSKTIKDESLGTERVVPNEIHLEVDEVDEKGTKIGSKKKPLARHPFPAVKMIVARDLNDVLSKGKNKDKMDKILRDCKEGSNGLMPVIVSCNKWNKVKTTQTILSQPDVQAQLTQDFQLKANDLLFILTGDWENVCNGLGKIRLNLKKLLKEGSVELLPAIIDGERLTPQERLPGAEAHGTEQKKLNMNPFTRFDDYLICQDWKSQNGSFFQNAQNAQNAQNGQQNDQNGQNGQVPSTSHLANQRKVLNPVGPLPTFHWVVDFPLFEPHIPSSLYQKQHTLNSAQNDNDQKDQNDQNDQNSSQNTQTPPTDAISISAMHHPFTAPNPQDIDEFNAIMTKFNAKIKIDPATNQPLTSSNNHPVQTHPDPVTGYPLDLITVSQQLGQVRALHYDLVANGLEVGGGSIRLHQPEMQKQVFDLLQVPHDKFAHLLSALELGAPPHGGFAAGLDRLIAIFGSQHPQGDPLKLKDVIAFPKSSTGNDLLLGTPNMQTKEQLDEYFIQVKEDKKE